MILAAWIFSIILFLILAYLLFMINPFKRPHLTESDYSHRISPYWELYYSSKYFFHVKRARKGEGVDTLFRKNMASGSGQSKLENQATITLHAVGDLMQRRDLIGEGGKNLWTYIGKDFFNADLCLGNLEFAINNNWVIEKLLRYSVPESFAEPLLTDSRFGKFHAVFLGNNHINDSLSGGILSTCDYLDKNNIIRSGAHRIPDEQDNFPIIDCKGVKIALLSYTFSTNNIPLDKGFEFGTNCVRFNALDDNDYDPSIIHKHIALAKKRGADFIISSHHWGVEFEYYPPKRLIDRAHDLLDSGIDCIIGHHPHIINPVERYVTKDKRETVVLYSLGSLTTYALLTPMQRLSTVAELILETGVDSQGKKTVRIGEITCKPVFHCMAHKPYGIDNRLIPLYEAARALEHRENRFNLSPHFRKTVRRLYKEHQRHFVQNGINFV